MLSRRTVLIPACFAVTAILAAAMLSAVVSEGGLRAERRAVDGSPSVNLYPGTVWRTVRIVASDGPLLEAWFGSPKGRDREQCVMVLHGISDSRTGSAGFAPMFLSQGYAVLLPDLRGHGRSGGEIVSYGVQERHDALRWAHWMKAQGCDNVYALGESLGAAILIQAAAAEPVFSAIAAEGSFTDLRTIAEYRIGRRLGAGQASRVAARAAVSFAIVYGRLRYGVDLEGASPLEAIQTTRTPILLIHGTDDSDTPYKHSVRLAEANPLASLWLVPGAGHTGASSAAPAAFRARVLEWFARHRD